MTSPTCLVYNPPNRSRHPPFAEREQVGWPMSFSVVSLGFSEEIFLD